jgi:hypothetical protein
MDRGELLAAIAAAGPGPVDIVYIERRGEVYSCRVSSPEEDLLLGGVEGEFPDVWIYWSGDWPAHDPERQRAVFDDLLEEMETMVTGGDRCRWSPADPWPRSH